MTLVGVPTSEVKRALAQHVYLGRVREDFMSGVRSGVNRTPTFFINSLRHDGSYERTELLAAIAEAGVKGQPCDGVAPARLRAQGKLRKEASYV